MYIYVMGIDVMETIIKEIQREINDNIVLVNIVERTSESYYNYKTRYVAIFLPPLVRSYEEDDILEIREFKVFCGVYQEIPHCEDLVDKLRDLGFTVIER